MDILTQKKAHLYNLLQNDPKILYLQKIQSGDVQCLHEKKGKKSWTRYPLGMQHPVLVVAPSRCNRHGTASEQASIRSHLSWHFTHIAHQTSPQLPIGPLDAITEPVPSEPPMSQ